MKQLLLLLSFCLIATSAIAQQSQPKPAEVEMPPKLLPYSNPLTETRDKLQLAVEPQTRSEIDTEVLRRISNTYRQHVLAIDAQVQGDLVQAENYINEAFASIQSLMDDYPEIQNNRRFAELYRSVMAEHSEFYGITELRGETERRYF
jgi:membrane-bound lytic murein transglycosylase D